MPEIVVIGGGGHARVIISILKRLARHRIIGYTDAVDRGRLLGAERLGDDAVLPELKRAHPVCAAAIGVGCVDRRGIEARRSIYALCIGLGFDLPAIVSPAALINEDVQIGPGTVVCDGVVINTGTRIGTCCILNTQSSIDHDCTVGDFVHVAPGSTLSGGVRVGSDTFIGTGASVIHSITIVDGCVIGAGAAVVGDCAESGTYFGVPARLIP